MKFSKKLLSAALFGFSLATFTTYSTLAYAETDLDHAVRLYRVHGNYEYARDLLLPLAKQGDVEAQYHLGNVYSRSTTKNEEESLKWYRKAAEQGYADAQYYLGLAYELGHGVPDDQIKAKKWYRKAAEQGHAKAQYQLGWAYKIGIGVPEDQIKAKKWFKKACQNGYRMACE